MQQLRTFSLSPETQKEFTNLKISLPFSHQIYQLKRGDRTRNLWKETEREYSQNQKTKNKINPKRNTKQRKKLKTKINKTEKLILSCDTDQEVSLKLVILPVHVAKFYAPRG